MNEIRVAGEPGLTLLEAFQQFKWKKARNGMQTASFSLEPRPGNPLIRALMRVEAELLLEDADSYGHAARASRSGRAIQQLNALGAERVVHNPTRNPTCRRGDLPLSATRRESRGQ
jgi:hypothetical protein